MKLMTRAVAAVSVLLCTGPAFGQQRVAQAPPITPTPPPPATDVYAPPPPPVAPAPAPVPPAPPSLSDWTFAFHGIVGTSLYIQDNATFVLNGQGPLLPLVARPAVGGGLTTGADIRQSRFNTSLAGPKVLGGAVPKAVLEIDLFGLDSPGGYGQVSAYERVRLAYAELKWENDLIRFGQDHNLILGLVPEGLGHLAYPVNYFAGSLGWREPGIGYFHTFPLGGSKLELALQINKSDWESPADFGIPNGNPTNVNDLDVDLGQLSGLFGVEARAKYTSEHVVAFVAGHWNEADGTRAAALVANYGGITSRNWQVVAGTAGIKLMGAGFTFLLSGYAGQNLGPLLGEQLQFFTSNDVFEVGGWAQLLYAITPHLNVSIVGGTAQPRGSDIKAAAQAAYAAAVASAPTTPGTPPVGPQVERATNTVFGGMIRYQDGGFAIGPEFHHALATTMDNNGNTANVDGNQFMLSGMYFF